jgi:hypothetical protein
MECSAGICWLCFTDSFRLNAVVTFRKYRCKSHFAQVGTEYTHGQLYVYIQGSPVEIQTPAHWKLSGRLAACVIAQQYSSSVFVSLRSHSERENSSALSKKSHSPFFNIFFKNRLSP